MGKIGAVTITEVYSPVSRLELVDKAAWPDLIHKKANFAASALNEDLAIALEILDEFEKHQAWNYVGMDRAGFLKFRVHVEPDNLEQIRAGYTVLKGRGIAPKHWQEAIDAVPVLGNYANQSNSS